MRSLAVRLLGYAFPVLLIAAVVGIAFVTLHRSSSDTSSNADNSGAAPTGTAQLTYPKGYPVIFSAIIDSAGTTYPPDVPDPSQEYAVQNPVTVRMAIGGGLAYQPESEAPEAGKGHLHVLIDTPMPLPLDTVPSDDSHIDLADGGYKLTLPTLEPGEHVITAIWTNSHNEVGPTVVYSRVKLNVTS